MRSNYFIALVLVLVACRNPPGESSVSAPEQNAALVVPDGPPTGSKPEVKQRVVDERIGQASAAGKDGVQPGAWHASRKGASEGLAPKQSQICASAGSAKQREPLLRISDGVTDAKLNGEPILLQEEISEGLLSAHPDTVQAILKAHYWAQESRFPRSVADDVERGVARERVMYPTLHYTLELYEDAYARKPYRVAVHRVAKEGKGLKVW